MNPHCIPARLAAAVLSLASCCAAVAQQAGGAAPAVPTVTVPYTRDPVDKSYRKMVRGMERYQRERALAPRSVLRFQVLPRQPGVKLDGVTLKVVGDSIALPVAMAPDHSFTLERNEHALREDAALVANRKTSSMTWRAMVRSDGVPAGMRRLGDLRLECLVGMEAGLVSNNSALFGWLNDMLTDADKVCASPEGNYLQFADRPLFGVTLHAGGRSMALPFRPCTRGARKPTPPCPTAIARCCWTAAITPRYGTAAGRTMRCSVSSTWMMRRRRCRRAWPARKRRARRWGSQRPRCASTAAAQHANTAAGNRSCRGAAGYALRANLP